MSLNESKVRFPMTSQQYIELWREGHFNTSLSNPTKNQWIKFCDVEKEFLITDIEIKGQWNTTGYEIIATALVKDCEPKS